ncbi:MAG: hypothetical protein LH702_01770, partial [Phormidesmis sp. CAN_BIN44]|nr:hypothetical protein [Phormidesmis sp. CAN_BIN44]
SWASSSGCGFGAVVTCYRVPPSTLKFPSPIHEAPKFSYLNTLTPDERASEIQRIEAQIKTDPGSLVTIYRDTALQQLGKDNATSMIVSITGVGIGSILAGAFIGFPMALTAGAFMLAQQFWNGTHAKRSPFTQNWTAIPPAQ